MMEKLNFDEFQRNLAVTYFAEAEFDHRLVGHPRALPVMPSELVKPLKNKNKSNLTKIVDFCALIW